MLILTDNDIERIAQTDELVRAIERAYLIQENESTNIPDRLHLSRDDKTLLVMPGIIEDVLGTKLVTVYPDNKKAGVPAIYGMMILNDKTTGKPIAVLNGSKLTAVRTGAVGATAAKYLAPASSQTLGIIGTGIQAYYQTVMVSTQHPFRKILLYNTNHNKAEDFKSKLKKKVGEISIEIAENAESVVRNSEVIVTATSSSTPVFEFNYDTMKDKIFIAIGSYKPDMQELPEDLMEKANSIFVDTWHAVRESGDLRIPLEKGLLKKENLHLFNTVINKPISAAVSSLTIFKSVGSALFDLTVAEMLYNKAIIKGIGTKIDF